MPRRNQNGGAGILTRPPGPLPRRFDDRRGRELRELRFCRLWCSFRCPRRSAFPTLSSRLFRCRPVDPSGRRSGRTGFFGTHSRRHTGTRRWFPTNARPDGGRCRSGAVARGPTPVTSPVTVPAASPATAPRNASRPTRPAAAEVDRSMRGAWGTGISGGVREAEDSGHRGEAIVSPLIIVPARPFDL